MIQSSKLAAKHTLLPLSTSLHEPKCACSCFQSTVDIKRLVSLSSSSSSSPAGPGHGHGQPQPPGHGHPEKNGFASRIHHLPDLIQQSHHSPSSSTTIPSSSSSSSSSSSFLSSSSYASPAMSPQNPLDKFTAIEVCRPHVTQTNNQGMDCCRVCRLRDEDFGLTAGAVVCLI